MDKFVVKRQRTSSLIGEEPTASPEQRPEAVGRQSEVQQSTEADKLLSHHKMKKVHIKGSGSRVHKRNFQPHWLKTYPWLEYEEVVDAVFCRLCRSAFHNKLITFSTKLEMTFIELGCRNWKKAIGKFKKHEKSKCHREAVLKLASVKANVNVMCHFSNAKKIEMEENRLALLKILSSLQFLAIQGLAIRGHTDESSNFVKLLKLRCEDCPMLKKWLDRDSFKWCSHETCNEMLEIMSHHVTRSLVSQIIQAQHYAIMVDETSDFSIEEQVSICFRLVTNDLKIEELFLGFYSTADTKSETLFNIIMDVLRRFNLPVTNCRGQCFDGAQNMAGTLGGVQTRIKREESRASFVHCMAHSLSLTVQDLIKQISRCRNVLNLVREIISFVRDSPRRLNKFKNLQGESDFDTGRPSKNLRPFCPTRWTVRHHSLSSILSNYKELLKLMEELAESENSIAGDKANDFITQMTTFDFFFHLSLLCKVFSLVDTVNTALQAKSLHFQQATEMISSLLQHLTLLRMQNKSFWDEVNRKAEHLCVSQPILPRQRRIPRRLDDAKNTEVFPFSVPEDFYHQAFNEVVDTVIECVETRFKSQTFELMVHAEQFLIGTKTEFQALSEHFKDDIDEERVVLQRDMFLDVLKTRNESVGSVSSVVDVFQREPQLKTMLQELFKFVQLLLTIPTTTSTAERSFSSLRRLKNYLRSTMTQKRLNHLAILNVHLEESNSLDMDSIANDFISRKEIRKTTFAVKINK